MKQLNRRDFLKAAGVAAAASVAAGCAQTSNSSTAFVPTQKGKSVIGLIAPKMDVVRVGFIGVGQRGYGQRGYGHVRRMSHIEGAEIVAICDNHDEVLERSANYLVERGLKNLHCTEVQIEPIKIC